ncbi:hypothetical protein EDD11_008081 [Mortierella claussenii]|nr:hypothetical protein EDD11_008081 [Mortierella claussenii]
MQALTPLLFSMLFPRFSSKSPTTEADYAALQGSDYPHESLLSDQSVRRASSASMRSQQYNGRSDGEQPQQHTSFQDGYISQDFNEQQYLSAKVRRHRSAGSTLRSATDPTSDRSARSSGIGSGLNRNNTFPQTRRAAPPKRLSLDHAAFIATYPMLDGLGDTSSRRMNNSEYYAPILSSGSASSSSTRSVRKQRSQDMPAARSSTSSISSMVSDDSTVASSISSCASSIREPLTPTRSSVNYRSILSTSNKAISGSVATTKDLINLYGQEEGPTCLSPQSSNFAQPDSAMAIVGTRGQRHLIAH